ncbi:MAG: chemotaxis protein CheW [Firmicutes bacterium]|nr:chemotaxis protein CheW [Bacillota bacterium]
MEAIAMDDSLIMVSAEDVMRGKYLVFYVGDNGFGLEISYVTEIIGIQNITHVPHTHHYIKGIINLRGTVVPVMDMRLRFSLGEIEYTDRTCIVVINTDDICIGLIVDEVSEVVDIADENIQPPPPTTGGGINNYIRAIATVGGHVKQLLDLEKIF